MKAPLVFWIIALGAICVAKQQTVGDFTKSPSEHIINQIDQPVRCEISVWYDPSRTRGPKPNSRCPIRNRGARRSSQDQTC